MYETTVAERPTRTHAIKVHDAAGFEGMRRAGKLAAASRTAYRALLENDGFMTFYRQATPIDALEHSRIGSRPSRRTGKASLDDLRAIPWVFSWNQSRFYVPGWYGTGSALASLTDEEFAQLESFFS